jgi:CBS domain-containing protein
MKNVSVGTFLEQNGFPQEAVTVKEDATLREVMDTMLRSGEERSVFVVDDEGVLKGVISLGALARHFMHEEIAPQNGFSPATDILHYLTAEDAKDIMTREVSYCTMEDPLEEAAHKMLGRQVYKLLPVLDEAHRIVAVLNLISLLEFALDEEA